MCDSTSKPEIYRVCSSTSNSEGIDVLFPLKGNEKYLIPLYQRAYAWGNEQIEQLIEDIDNLDANNKNYYLGSLIVAKKKQDVESVIYEVVDGQQRLTTLFLLLNCLEHQRGIQDSKYSKNPLVFECRDKARFTLENISELLSGKELKDVDEGICNGIKIILDVIEKKCKEFEEWNERFIEKLSRVIIFKIELPKHTDLNHYFEIMNTSSEQLEQHDIVKADLLGYLQQSPADMFLFSEIWDACRDMTGYVQVHFDESSRVKMFGEDYKFIPDIDFLNKWKSLDAGWSSITFDSTDENSDDIWCAIKRKCNSKDYDTDNSGMDISRIINSIDYSAKFIDEENSTNNSGQNKRNFRFNSIIQFPYFLMHVLKVMVDNVPYLSNFQLFTELDDKKLKKHFDEVLAAYEAKGGNKTDFSKEYAFCLLRTRLLFDKFIIKKDYENAEYTEDPDAGKWSLKHLTKIYKDSEEYSDTLFSSNDLVLKGNDDCEWKINIMLQSSLRVSYTSPRVMHWITELLKYLYKNPDGKDIDSVSCLSEKAEYYIREQVKKDFSENYNDGKYERGVATPNLVFNYLDFLLWKERPNDYKDFQFRFRNSVEHFYPRNPSADQSLEKWNLDDSFGCCDRFGNLCLLSRSNNSKFSNRSPLAKVKDYKKTVIDNGSIKLRVMAEIIEKMDDNIDKNKQWKESECAKHEEEMLSKLMAAIGDLR